MINLSRVAIVKMISLANRGYELLNTKKDSVSLIKNGDEAVIDQWGRVTWADCQADRINQKSKRELFIETSMQLMTSETERTMEQMFGAQFDAGARYKDLTQYFGENI